MFQHILLSACLAAAVLPAHAQLLIPDSVSTVVVTSFATEYETDFVGPAEFGLGAGLTSAGVLHRISDQITASAALGHRSIPGVGSSNERSWNARVAFDVALPLPLPGGLEVSAGAFGATTRRSFSQRRTDVFQAYESQTQFIRGGAHLSLHRVWSWGRLAVAPTLRAEGDLGRSSFEIGEGSRALNEGNATLAGAAAVVTLPVSLRLVRGLHLNGGVSFARIYSTTLNTTNMAEGSFTDSMRPFFLGLSYGF